MWWFWKPGVVVIGSSGSSGGSSSSIAVAKVSSGGSPVAEVPQFHQLSKSGSSSSLQLGQIQALIWDVRGSSSGLETPVSLPAELRIVEPVLNGMPVFCRSVERLAL